MEILQDGKFHSGREIGEVLKVSRSAIWKKIRLLESKFNLEINKVRGHGYQLASPILLLSETALVEMGLPDICPFYIYKSLSSTNSEATRLLEQGVEPPFLVLSEQQTAGRGRRGKAWQSPFGANIYLSLALKVRNGIRELEGLPLVVGLAVMQALRTLGMDKVGLKWPNDILVQNKKIAGILCELTGDPSYGCHLVIGIGVNVNMELGCEGAESIDQSWTSIKLELQRLIDRNNLICIISKYLMKYLSRYAKSGFTVFHEEWEKNHLWQGREVVLTTGTQQFEGIISGIDHSGALRLNVNSSEQRYSAGEISLRLLNKL